MGFWRRAAVGIGLALSLGGVQASAAIITYDITGTTSGNVDGTSYFTDAPYTLTAEADTSTLQSCVDSSGPIPGCILTAPSTLSLTIAGLGAFALTDPSYVFDNQSANIFGVGVGFGNTFLFGNVTGTSGAFATYDLVSPIGPITSTGFFNASAVTTDRGVITFVPGTPLVTFQASLAAAVPEPRDWAVLLLGIALVGSALRRRTPAAAFA